MPDREMVIKGWECHMEADTLGCADCPYRQGWRTCNFADTLFKDVYALLKEQEPVAPVLVGRMWECGKCHAPVGIFMDDQRDQFCRTCGRSVKWE